MILTDLDFATVSETKAGLSGLLKRLKETHRVLAVTSHGKPSAIVLDFEEYRQMARRLEEVEATLEVMSDPQMLAGLRRGIEEAKTGKTFTFEEVFGKPLAPKSKPKRT